MEFDESTKQEFPLKRCQRDGSKGWKWGDNGHCYTRKEEGSDEAAKEKARKQGRAIKSKQTAFDVICEESIEQYGFPLVQIQHEVSKSFDNS